MGLLNLLRNDEQAGVDAAWRRYVALLEADSDDPRAVAELKAVMHTLGKTAADVEADLDHLQTCRRLLPIIADGSGLEADRAAAHQRSVDYAVETERLIASRAKELTRLQDAEGELSRRYMAADRSGKELEGLKQKHPKLLSHIDQPKVQ